MLPPVDPAVLNSHPKFQALYEDLCTNKLNQDGTSKILDAKVLKERETFAEDLRKARVEAARRDLVTSGLREIASGASGLPEDLRELVIIIAAVLEGQVADEDRDLLQDDVAKFKANVQHIAQCLSTHFSQDIESISTIIDPDDPPSSQNLTSTISSLKTSISSTEDRSGARRLELATEATRLHDLNRKVIEQTIALLEQSIHGSVARASKAKADYLATVAEGMSKKLALQSQQLNAEVYSSEVQEALRAKQEELEDRARATRRKIREREEELEGLRKVGGLEGVAEEYAQVIREKERVRAETARLQAELSS